MDSPKTPTAALHIVEEDGPALGPYLNHSKLLLFIRSGDDASRSSLPLDIPMAQQGLSQLGGPIGPPDFCKVVFRARLQKLKASLGAM